MQQERRVSGVGGAPGEQRQKLGAKERQLLLALIAGILVVTAIVLLTVTQGPHTVSRGGGSGQLAASCSGYLYTQDYYNCIYNVANTTKNTSVCNVLPAFGRDNCLTGVAVKTQNISVCGKMGSSSPAYGGCVTTLLRTTMNMSYCETLQFPLSSECIYNLSAKTGFSNLTMCSELLNSTYSTACTDLYYFEKADSTGDPTYCANLEKSAGPISLYTIELNESETNVSGPQYSGQILENSALNFTPYAYCNYRLAVDFKQKSLCQNLNSNLSRTVCNSTFLTPNTIPQNSLTINLNATNVTAACIDTQYRGLCAFVYEINKATSVSGGNESACLQLNESEGEDTCLYSLAITYKNPAYCNDVQSSNIAAVCFNQTTVYPSNFVIPNFTFTTTAPVGYT